MQIKEADITDTCRNIDFLNNNFIDERRHSHIIPT